MIAGFQLGARVALLAYLDYAKLDGDKQAEVNFLSCKFLPQAAEQNVQLEHSIGTKSLRGETNFKTKLNFNFRDIIPNG